MTAPRPVPREAVLIVNARSRKGRDQFRDARDLLGKAGIRLIAAHAVRDPRRLRHMVDQAVGEGAPMVIVGGGDGSLSCTIDYVVGHDTVFALLPLGTANSFARTLGIPLDLAGAVETIANGRRRRIDLGRIDGDYFANSAAMGLAPMIAGSVPHGLKRYAGRLGYLAWAIWCLVRFRPFTVRIDDGETSRTLTALELRIANGRFHGGVEVIESSDVDSGDIVVQAVTGHYKRKLVWNWFATFFRLAARHETVEEYRGRRLTIETRPSLRISIDGELLGSTPATVEVAERAVEVVVPAEPAPA
jgi:YegS/Rv2252/BmrU family lipid kinase